MEEISKDGSVNGSDGLLVDYVQVQIHVPEINAYKCLQFRKSQLVWDVKQQTLAALPKEFKEGFNYGLFYPPANGKAGKFLDEERRLGDYPFNGPVGYLELKYKKRLYKLLNLDEKQLKALHTRSNLKRFLEYVNNSQVEKIAKLCAKGLDPNFHCPETGETPLTLATKLKKCSKILMNLVNGGAILDFRTKDGTTSMHKAVEHNNVEAVTTLLELGASPNYKDAKGITPLYVAITHQTDAVICETLLHDRAVVGIQDLQGWQEVHQACRNGLAQHLEHLLFYGAESNARNASGNTPLHVCAVNGTEACARVLLFRGAQKEALNYAHQTPYQVAVIAGNLELAEVIRNHHPADIDKSIGDTSDIMSESSGIGTNSDSTITLPGTTVVCVEAYRSNQPGHLNIQQGDILEVTGATDCGLLEGSPRGRNLTGLFPPHCVQEVRLRHHPNQSSPYSGYQGGGGSLSHQNSIKHYATTPRQQKTRIPAQTRTVVLHRSRRGFGFVLRGAKAASPLMESSMCSVYPGLQYLDDVDRGGVADMAGLKKGDFLVAINGEDVSTASHEKVVDLIRKSGDLVNMTVVTLQSVPNPSEQIYKSMSSTPQQYATLPRKLSSGRPAPLPPRRDPKTTLSVGRARAKSMFAGMEGCNETDDKKNGEYRTASIRRPSSTHRVSPATLESMFHPKQVQLSPEHNGALVYTSVAEMKRRGKSSSSRVRFSTALDNLTNLSDLHRSFHSTPDLAAMANQTRSRTHNSSSEDNVTALDGGRSLPPPTHPPPPPPIAGTLVKVDLKAGPISGELVHTTSF
uniref:SH3 and multiple ankyrin repeat domains protein 3 n=1 Tax=Cacopsylla melanoneura TaxID=428564 RepID=A0A8D8TBH4_9HEMI